MKNKQSKNFWQALKQAASKRPILALAPMAGITDSPFRRICKRSGADVVYSEMASVAALAYNPAKTLDLIASTEEESPYVVQLFGSKPEHFEQAVKLLSRQPHLDGFDINFGCPVKKVAKQGAGAVLMDKPKSAREIVKAVLDSTDLPVSVKIRTLSGKTDALKFLDNINDLPVAAVMIHGRTMKQGHSGPVDWQTIKNARQHFGGVILANGGVVDRASGIELWKKSEADGLGIGQGALGRPWVFDQVKNSKFKVQSREEIFNIALEHAGSVIEMKGEAGLTEMRKHLCWYVSGQPDASELRRKLVAINSPEDIREILK